MEFCASKTFDKLIIITLSLNDETVKSLDIIFDIVNFVSKMSHVIRINDNKIQITDLLKSFMQFEEVVKVRKIQLFENNKYHFRIWISRLPLPDT